ncbi:DUF226 domain-containing protein [Borrelia sp. P9F1]|uniref:DUF226 domain-containing protein n=1 Tax=Borrelia sp. P9F1 TaxID=3058374 RepID=UPI002647956A|nr:DUF226 domain-containing protein [Borrelia sp. P9F1]WKC58473.1 DUF226 domain-containing protein [Borrelia sp. P9F1]
MISALEDKLAKKKAELTINETKETIAPKVHITRDANIFAKIEQDGDRKLYYTRLVTSFYTFKVHRDCKDKFWIAFRGMPDLNEIYHLNLFSLAEGDKFKGIFYGFQKLKNGINAYYMDSNLGQRTSFRVFKVYHIEFRFKRGSVFCRMDGLHSLIQKEKVETKYCKLLFELIEQLERKVYEFYNKKLPKGGMIGKWREKNLK